MTHSNDTVIETTVSEGQMVMPYYLIVDVSGSMHKEIRHLNDAVNEMAYSISADPVVEDLVMLGIIAFNDKAHTVASLGPASGIRSVTFKASGQTNYGAAFHHFKSTFDEDRARLKSLGMQVFRPCVFFFTDGYPGDHDFQKTFRSLFEYDPQTGLGNKAFPYFVPFGVRDADPAVLESIAYPNFGAMKGRWFLSKATDVGAALRAMTGAVAKSVLSSGRSASTGAPQLIPPQLPPGLNAQFGEAGDWV